jgi:hypothetical protein
MAANRLFLSVLFLLNISFSGNSTAQTNTPVLERKVNISAMNKLPSEILKNIEEQANFTFSYDPRVIGEQKPVSIQANNKSVREVLDQLFNGKVNYKEKGNHIILVSAPVKSEEQYFIITGYVKDGITGSEVPEASIFDKKSRESAVSDLYGYFKIRVDSKQRDQVLSLSVNKANYNDTIVYIRQKGNSIVNITIYSEINAAVVDSNAIRDSLLAVDQLAMINMILSDEAEVNTKNIKDTLYSKFQLSFLPFLGTNLKLSGNTINDYSVNILAGYSMGTRKLEIGGLVNVDRDSVSHVQLAGLSNVTGGPVNGFQAAGLINFNMKPVRGCQVAGLINNNIDTSHAAEFAGLLNLNLKPTTGFQAAGLMNLNIKKSGSAQVAGLTNIGVESVRGSQISGLLNVCVKEIHGAQISGLVNYAAKVRGTQIGFLNISDSCSGVPVGFMSLVKSGYHELEVSADETFPLSVSFRTGVRSFYNIITAGIQTLKEPDNIWYFGYGVGSAINLGKKWNLNLDLTMNQPIVGNQLDYFNPLTRLNVTVEKRFSKYFSLAAGPTLNVFFVNTLDPQFDGVFKDLPPSEVLYSSVSGDYKQTRWIGGKIALRFF